MDGAQPSGNSVSVQNLIYLARELDNEDYLEHAERTIRSVSGILSNWEMFTVRRIVAGEGVERKFPLHSPRVGEIEVKRSSNVRRAKLYFLRDRIGKAVRLKERRRN